MVGSAEQRVRQSDKGIHRRNKIRFEARTAGFQDEEEDASCEHIRGNGSSERGAVHPLHDC